MFGNFLLLLVFFGFIYLFSFDLERFFNPWFDFLTFSWYLDELTKDIWIWFDVLVLSVSWSNIALLVVLETKFLRDFIVVFLFKSFKIHQNAEQFLTVRRLKNALNRSLDMIRDRLTSISARHNYVNNRPFCLCTLLLTYVLYLVT